MNSGNPRRDRVAQVLRDALARAISADVRDPRVAAAAMLTVTRVEMNVDMAVANVFVSVVPRPPSGISKGHQGLPPLQGLPRVAGVVGDDAAAIAGLRKSAGFLRGRVGRLAGLQRAPELRFFADHSLDMGEKIAQILRDDAERAGGVAHEGSSEAGSGGARTDSDVLRADHEDSSQ